MEQLLEYVARHPFLAGGTLALAVAVLAYEVSRARSGGASVGAMEAVRLMNQGALVLDVRSQAEFDSGHIREARHVPQDQVGASAETLKKYKDKVIVAYCESGMRSGAAARVLRTLGFAKTVNLRGGLQAWRAENLPVVKSGAKAS